MPEPMKEDSMLVSHVEGLLCHEAGALWKSPGTVDQLPVSYKCNWSG